MKNSSLIDAEEREVLANLSDVYLQQILKEHLFDLLKKGLSLGDVEKTILKEMRYYLRNALGAALEDIDQKIYQDALPAYVCVDKQKRELLTLFGSVSFKRRIYQSKTCQDGLQKGQKVRLLDRALGITPKSRLSPYVQQKIIEYGPRMTSYAAVAEAFEDVSKESISAVCVKTHMDAAGVKIAKRQVQAAKDLFSDGVIPEAEKEAQHLFLEADGTFVHGKEHSFEVRTSCVYPEKKRDKSGRGHVVEPLYFGAVCSSDAFWKQTVSQMLSKYNYKKLQSVDAGSDGEASYQRLSDYLPHIAVTQRLDTYHISHYVGCCFDRKNAACAREVMACIARGRLRDALLLLVAYAKEGLCQKEKVVVALRYLLHNQDKIFAGPSPLGTQESMERHLIKERMGGARVWSKRGADNMARCRAALKSGFELPVLSDADMNYLDQILAELNQDGAEGAEAGLSAAQANKQEGFGYEYPCSGSLKGFMHAGNCDIFSVLEEEG